MLFCFKADTYASNNIQEVREKLSKGEDVDNLVGHMVKAGTFSQADIMMNSVDMLLAAIETVEY